MDLLPLALGFLLLNGLGKKNNDKTADLGNIFSNADAMSLIPQVGKLLDKNATQDEKNTAMTSLLTNPAVFDIMSKLAPKEQKQEPANEPPRPAEEKQKEFSSESRDFFRPVEKVAGVEISHKLYGLYDNWYIKK